MNNTNYSKTREHIRAIMPRLKHAAAGKLKHPFLSVGYGQHYAGCIYSWDNHHMSLRFAAAGEPEQMRFFTDNMLACQAASGYVPSVISAANGGGGGTLSNFHAQPFLAQNAAMYTRITGDTAWALATWPALRAYLDYWLTKHAAPFGLYRWHESYMSGVDNEIAGTILPAGAIISPDLNAWLYLELRAMAWLAAKLDQPAEHQDFSARAEALKQAINDRLWDERTGAYAAYNLCQGRCMVAWADATDGDAGTLTSEVGRYAFLSCPALIPLFARIAPANRAARMIRDYVLNPRHYRSPFGIRSLSYSSEYYNQARWGNPSRFGDQRRLTNSNWQGPVWIPINWFVFHALLHYGFVPEAADLANDTFKVIAMSVDKLGFMRENFDAETGEGLYADHFASWNILADLMPDYLPGGTPTFDPVIT